MPASSVVEKWAPLARHMAEHPGKIEAISGSLAKAKLGTHVRFGCFGPTFEEIARVLART